MPFLVEGWTDDDRSASSKWTNTEYHSCEVEYRRYVVFLPLRAFLPHYICECCVAEDRSRDERFRSLQHADYV